jgi:hypothetical protein
MTGSGMTPSTDHVHTFVHRLWIVMTERGIGAMPTGLHRLALVGAPPGGVAGNAGDATLTV